MFRSLLRNIRRLVWSRVFKDERKYAKYPDASEAVRQFQKNLERRQEELKRMKFDEPDERIRRSVRTKFHDLDE